MSSWFSWRYLRSPAFVVFTSKVLCSPEVLGELDLLQCASRFLRYREEQLGSEELLLAAKVVHVTYQTLHGLRKDSVSR